MTSDHPVWAATVEDIQGLVELGRHFHAAADLGGVYSPGTFGGFCHHLITSEEGCVFRSARGMIGGHVAGLPWDSTYKVANEAFWWAEDGAGIALMQAYEQWGSEVADEVRMAFLPNLRPSATARVLGRHNYMAVEVGMVKQW